MSVAICIGHDQDSYETFQFNTGWLEKSVSMFGSLVSVYFGKYYRATICAWPRAVSMKNC